MLASASPTTGTEAGATDFCQNSQEALSMLLEAHGFKPATAFGGGGQVVRRDGLTLVIHLCLLGGRIWSTGKDSLAPWRSVDGQEMGSPCRLVWQRATVHRSMDRRPA